MSLPLVYTFCVLLFLCGLEIGYGLRMTYVDYCVRRAQREGRMTETELVDGRIMLVLQPKRHEG